VREDGRRDLFEGVKVPKKAFNRRPGSHDKQVFPIFLRSEGKHSTSRRVFEHSAREISLRELRESHEVRNAPRAIRAIRNRDPRPTGWANPRIGKWLSGMPVVSVWRDLPPGKELLADQFGRIGAREEENRGKRSMTLAA